MDKRVLILQLMLMVMLFGWWQFADDVNEKLNILFVTSWLAFMWRM
jgi:hypothetical protein